MHPHEHHPKMTIFEGKQNRSKGRGMPPMVAADLLLVLFLLYKFLQ